MTLESDIHQASIINQCIVLNNLFDEEYEEHYVRNKFIAYMMNERVISCDQSNDIASNEMKVPTIAVRPVVAIRPVPPFLSSVSPH